MKPDRKTVHRTKSEEGFVLIAVLFLVALILIALAVAAPKVAKEIQRDKELELVHRGEQYKRAIKLYYKKFGAYPSTIDQLLNTNQVRFLRKRYTDPFTGKDDWKVIYFGQAHIQPLGLFGQPIAAAGLTGVGGTMPGTGAGSVGTPIGSSTGSGIGSTTGGTDGSGSSFGSSSGSSFGSSSGSSFGSSSGSTFGSSSGTGTDSGFGSSPGTGSTPGTGTGTPGTGTGTGSAFGSTGSSGSTLGGGPIVGVVIPSTNASIKEYKKQKHYNEWEFVYNPIEEQLQAAGMMGGGQQNLNGASTVSGNGFSNSTGGTNGFGSSPTNGGLSGSAPTGTGMTPPQQ